MIGDKKRSGYIILYVVLIAAAVILCILSAPLQESTFDTLKICAGSLVPSLFPFMVISSMLTQSAPYLFTDSKRNIPLLGLPSCSLIAIILGALCGFPTGVVTVSGLKTRGLISKDNAENLAMISNNTGPAFVIEVIGGSFWGSRVIGIKLYLIQLLSCFILCMLYFCIIARNKTTDIHPSKRIPELTGSDFASFFCEAIASASFGVIKICGFVVFFSVIVESIKLIFPLMNMQSTALLSSILEFTSGCRTASAIGSREALALCAFSIGFSGLSVIAQSASFSSKAGFSLKKTVVFKFFQGLLCALLAYFII